VQNPAAAYSAILDFGFGSFILNIMETDPAWIGRQIAQIRMWYFSIVAVVSVAAAGGLASLWRNVREQVKLAQKKDDFISAVSHELRTPLTSIRMYSEMLDRDWVKSPEKQKQYYTSLRQESERLSRLIENVLDFSRIQKGRKTYNFRVGQIDKCVESVVEMMRPYASQNGFKIVLECNANTETSFDSDTVTQIVVNLIDNAVKYARDAEDKTIYVRTQNRDGFILIEVEDRGPGIPHHQQKKVFEEFYRVEAENTRQTLGMGLGLALVRRFAEAHNGFVEILSAKPTGSLFRVALAAQS
jgi:signal transduction histidine kinase